MRTNEIELMQSDEQLSVTINGQNMSDLFSGYILCIHPTKNLKYGFGLKGNVL